MQELRGQEGQSQDMQQQAGGIRSIRNPSDMDVKEDSVESSLAVRTKKSNMEILTQPGHKSNALSFENEQAYDDQYQYRAARTEKHTKRFTNGAPG